MLGNVRAFRTKVGESYAKGTLTRPLVVRKSSTNDFLLQSAIFHYVHTSVTAHTPVSNHIP